MQSELWTIINIADLVAVAVFAISGALAAAEKKLDILNFVLFGTITGVGGGTFRDLLLGIDAVFWIADTRYLWVCIGCSLATWYLAPLLNSLHRVLLWADAIGLALFSVLGSMKALAFGAPPVVAVVLGMMTATFGSLIRDTLLNQQPVLLDPEIYVTAALLGAVSYVALQSIVVTSSFALPIAISLAFLLRASAIIFDLRLPKYGR
ncbi:MAG: trimeric intracellular cation channel family protein [Halioglobus sp.]